MGEEAALLRDVADPALLGVDVRALAVDDLLADRDGAAVGSLEAGQQPQQRRLAAARRSENGGQRSGGHLEIQAGEDGVGPEALVQVG